MTKKITIPPAVPKASFDRVVAALAAGILMLEKMEDAGAVRLPFPGYAKTVKQMQDAVKK